MTNREHFVRDSLLEGAAIEQTKRGMIPTTTANADYVVGVLEPLAQAQAQAAAKPAQVATQPEPRPRLIDCADDEFQKELKIRCRRFGMPTPEGWTIDRGAKEKLIGGPATTQKLISEATRRMRRRLQFLRTMPEWHLRFRQINPLALQGQLGKAKKREAEIAVRKILAAADVKFGPWWKSAPARPLWFSSEGTRATRIDRG